MKGTTTRRGVAGAMLLAICAVLMAGVLVLAGCPSDSDDGGGSTSTLPAAKGKLTITDIPAKHNGKYIWLSVNVVEGNNGTTLYGATDITGFSSDSDMTYKLVKIVDGKAEVPLYTVNYGATSSADLFKAYTGSDAVQRNSYISILDDKDGSLPVSEMSKPEFSQSRVATMGLSSDLSFSNGNLTVTWKEDNK